MHYGLTDTLTIKPNSCLVIGFLSHQSLPNLDSSLTDIVSHLQSKMKEAGDLLWQSDFNGGSLLLIHCGEAKKWSEYSLNQRVTDVSKALIKQRIQSATVFLPRCTDQNVDDQLQQMVLAFDHQLYQMLDFKSGEKKRHGLESVYFHVEEASPKTLNQASAIAQGIHLTRNLANLPANICTPTYLAQQAIELAQQCPNMKTKVMDQNDMKTMGMGAFLAVAQGSVQPPQFIEIQYHGSSQSAPIVLVGKGVTFDSGGISLKRPEGMEEMKFDMAGAASVLGTLKACAMMKLPLHVVGLIPTTENMPSGAATKPGDIITTMSGKTVEITNTDAEGRLILADALTYAERFNPEFVIDIATLTGACIIALGHEETGLMTTDNELADWILSAAKQCGDATWRLPLHEAYQELIDSPLADMANSTGGREAGTITAACFLSRYTQKYRWAHLDIAGTAWVSGKLRHATGRPVTLLSQLLNNIAHAR